MKSVGKDQSTMVRIFGMWFLIAISFIRIEANLATPCEFELENNYCLKDSDCKTDFCIAHRCVAKSKTNL